MNKKILSTIGIFSFFISFTSQAETFQHYEYQNVLDKEIISIEKVVVLKEDENKNMENYISLADFYIFSDTYRDTFQSFDFYQKAAYRGSEYAKLMVGYMTYKGYGTDVNVFKGAHLLNNVKKPYDDKAKQVLAKEYIKKEQFDKAISLLENIESQKSFEYLSSIFFDKKEYDKAMIYLNKAINKYNSKISRRLKGEILLTPKFDNEKEAVENFIIAAESGDVRSQYLLGMYYKKGTDKKRADMQEAVRWFAIGAQNNDISSTRELLNIWNDNSLNNDLYGIKNDPYYIKLVNDKYTKMNTRHY